MKSGDILTLTPINDIVRSGKYSGPNAVLTLLRFFSEPDNIYYKQGVGTHNRFAQALLGSDDYTKIASAGRLGSNYKLKDGILVYSGGGSLSREKGFLQSRQEFETMYNLIVGIIGSAGMVDEGFE